MALSPKFRQRASLLLERVFRLQVSNAFKYPEYLSPRIIFRLVFIFITPSSPASPFVPSLKELECAVSCSFSTAFFLGIIIRNNSLSFFHIDCSYFPLLHSSQYIYPGHTRTYFWSRREGLSLNTGIYFLGCHYFQTVHSSHQLLSSHPKKIGL